MTKKLSTMQKNRCCLTSSKPDVTMGAYDGAEVSETVGSFLLHTLSLKYNKTNIGLYRDDGLAVFRNVSGPHCEKIKKDFQKLFQQHGLKLIIKCNLKIVDFLDVTLNLTNLTLQTLPYHKPSPPKQIHVSSL